MRTGPQRRFALVITSAATVLVVGLAILLLWRGHQTSGPVPSSPPVQDYEFASNTHSSASRLSALAEISSPNVVPPLQPFEVGPVMPETGLSLATNDLLEAAADHTRPLQERVLAAHLLGRQRVHEAYPLFLNIVTNDSEPLTVRYKAARGLGFLGNPDAIPSLDRILSNMANDRHLRVVSALALGNLGTEDGIRSLTQASTDDDELVRFKALQALGRTGDTTANTAIAAGLADPDAYVQARAIHSLGDVGDRSAVPLITDRLATSDSDFVKIACIEALGKLAGEPSLAALKTYTTSSNSLLRDNALRAIDRLKEVSP